MAKDPGNSLKQAKQITVTAKPTRFRDTIGAKDKFDYYRFKLAAPSSFATLLSGLKAPANLSLLKRNGGVLISSIRPKNQNEIIVTNLTAGTYYLKVFGFGKKTSYTLGVVAAPPNKPPTNIGLSKTSIAENEPVNSVIGNLTTIDPNVRDTHIYTLVAGAGGVDNAAFSIEGNVLKAKQPFDFEVKNSYSILVKTDDRRGGTFTKQFTIAVTDINEPIVTNTPPIVVSSAIGVGKGSLTSIGGSSLKVVDAEQSAGQLVYTLTSLPQNGVLLRNGVPLSVNDRFTQSDVDLGTLSYQSVPQAIALKGDFVAIEGNQIVLRGKVADADPDTELFLFNGSTGVTTQLTNNAVNETFLGFEGSTVVWSSLLDTVGTELFSYNSNTGQTRQLTDSRTEVPTFKDMIGSKVFWGSASSGSYERFFTYDAALPNGQPTLINTATLYGAPRFEGSKVFYQTRDAGQNSEADLFFYDSATGVSHQMSFDSTLREEFIATDGSYAVWRAWQYYTSDKIYLYNLDTKLSTLITTPNNFSFQGMSGSNVAWYVINTPGLFFYNGSTGETNTNLFADPAFAGETQQIFHGVSGSNVVWSSFVGTDRELRLYNADTETTIPLTGNETGGDGSKNDTFQGISGSTIFWETEGKLTAYNIPTGAKQELTDTSYKINGSNVVWSKSDGTDIELFFYNGSTQQTIQLTNNNLTDSFDERSPFDRSHLYWSNADIVADKYFHYDIATGQTTWLVGGDNITGGTASDLNVAWTGRNVAGTAGLFYSNGSFAAADNFGFTVNDGLGGLATGTFNITIS